MVYIGIWWRSGMFETMIDVNEEDQLLLLITCVGDDDERLIIASRRLRGGEQANSLEQKAKRKLAR